MEHALITELEHLTLGTLAAVIHPMNRDIYIQYASENV